jgi:hypothetical protein
MGNNGKMKRERKEKKRKSELLADRLKKMSKSIYYMLHM